MSIDARLIDENENSIAEVIDNSNLTLSVVMLADNETSICLKYIDPYGDTIFNRLQLQMLSKEISEVKHKTKDKSIISHCNILLELISMASPHNYIKFYGD